ncbi:MAG TPA: DUF3828 domain-containing protein [Alphaproteobacteria bacterium]|nr:DUF3828 domain-containing protein [Alphaproteobacteria bacterium]
MGRLIVAVLLWVAIATGAMAAPVFDDPKGLIEYAYAPYENDTFPGDPTELYSPTLRQLWADMAARSEATGEPILDFDPLINAQDYELSELIIADPVVKGDSAEVAVSFSNFGEPQELHFYLVRRAEGWKIDDIESVGPYPWRLSELLAANPLLN